MGLHGNIGPFRIREIGPLTEYPYFKAGKYDEDIASMQNAFAARFSHKYTTAQWSEFFADFEEQHNPFKMKGLIAADQMLSSDTNIDNWTETRLMLSQQFHIVRWNMMRKLYEDMKAIAQKYGEAIQSNKLSDSDLTAILSGLNPTLGLKLKDPRQNGAAISFGTNWAAAFRNFEYYGGGFHDNGTYTAEQNAENALQNAQQIRQSIEIVGLQNTEAGKKALQFAGLLESLSNLFLGNVKKAVGSYDGEIQKIGQYEFRWDAATKQWLIVTKGAQDFLQTLLLTCSAFEGAEGVQQMYNAAKNNFVNLKKEVGAEAFDKALNEAMNGPNPAPKFYNPNDKRKVIPAYLNINGQQRWTIPSAQQYLSGLVGGKAGDPKKKPKVLEGGDHDNDGLNTNLNTNDYKSRYQNNAAAPKQVIVNIDSLLTVEHVDMADPKKAETVYNLKKDLSQALIDVVHEFDATWHG